MPQRANSPALTTLARYLRSCCSLLSAAQKRSSPHPKSAAHRRGCTWSKERLRFLSYRVSVVAGCLDVLRRTEKYFSPWLKSTSLVNRFLSQVDLWRRTIRHGKKHYTRESTFDEKEDNQWCPKSKQGRENVFIIFGCFFFKLLRIEDVELNRYIPSLDLKITAVLVRHVVFSLKDITKGYPYLGGKCFFSISPKSKYSGCFLACL